MAQLQLAVSLLPTWIPFFYTAELRSQARRNGGRTARENRLIWTSKNRRLFREAKQIPRPFRAQETHRTTLTAIR